MRDSVRAILGQVEDDNILDHCIQAFALGGVVTESSRNYASDSEILTGALIAKAFTYLTTRTFEGRPLNTGILVCPPNQCIDFMTSHEDGTRSDEFYIQFANPVQPDWSNPSEVAPYAQLADGQNSILFCDSLGFIYGVINIESISVKGISFNLGGYALITSKNRDVALYFSWAFATRIAAFHDGYQWGYGIPDALELIRDWLIGEMVRAGEFALMYSEGCKPEAVIENVGRIQSLVEMIQDLSKIRLSSIIVICHEERFSPLRDAGNFRSLRKQLDGATWEWTKDSHIGLNYLPVFRLDGAHIFSAPHLRVLAVGQHVHISGQQGIGEQGTGRTAAMHASTLLGDGGIVVKISSDGPISVYQNGAVMTNVERIAVDYYLTSNGDHSE